MSEPRPNSAQRGYGAQWRKRRAAQLKRQPWCELCEQKPHVTISRDDARWAVMAAFDLPPGQTAATTVDHRKARRTFPPELQGSDAPGGSDHPDNLRSLCHSCHSKRGEDKARSHAK